jgi:hypothetical protein
MTDAAGEKKLGSENARANFTPQKYNHLATRDIDTTLHTIHCPLKCVSWAFPWVSSAPEEG